MGTPDVHEALDRALSDAFTGDRQKALGEVLAEVREHFSPGEFQHVLHMVWPEPLVERSLGQEIIDGKLAEGLAILQESGDTAVLMKWVGRYLEAVTKRAHMEETR